MRLLPYPMYLPKTDPSQLLPESHIRAAVDVATHGPCVGIGDYEPLDGGRGDYRVVYLHLPVPEPAVM